LLPCSRYEKTLHVICIFAWFCVSLVTDLPVVVQGASGPLSSLDISANDLTHDVDYEADMTGIIALSEALPKW
jgi:hypothetical protein